MKTNPLFSFPTTILLIALIHPLTTFQNKFCDVAAINSIKANGITFPKPNKARRVIKKICPSLKLTCCNYVKLYDFAESYQKGREQLNAIKEFYSDIKEMIASIDSELINKYIETDFKDIVGQKFSNAEIDQIKAAVDNIKASEEKTDAAVDQLISSVARYYSGFGCSICDPANMSSLFSTYKSDNTYISFSFENYQVAFSIMLEFIQIARYLQETSYLARLGYVIRNQEISPDVKFFDDIINGGLEELFKKCTEVDEFEIKEGNNIECLKHVNSVFGLASFKLFAKEKETFETIDKGLFWLKHETDVKKQFVELPGIIEFYPIIKDSMLDEKKTVLVTGANFPILLNGSEFEANIWQNGVLPEYNLGEATLSKGFRDEQNKLLTM